jgi:hypothetical protein
MALRIVVGGGIARNPVATAGYTWAFLQYVLGLRRLGHQVLYVEQLAAADCIDDQWRPVPFAASANVRLAHALADRFALHDQFALLHEDGQHAGPSAAEVAAWADGADLVVNLSGRLHRPEVLHAARRRVYVDLDPGFTQIWQARYGADMNLAGHDAYASVGLNLGTADCPVPTLGLPWRPLLPPVVLDHWTPAGVPGDAYTTVADWRGYAPVEWDGVWYKQKSDEFLRLLELPSRVSRPLEICLAIHPDEPDLPRLLGAGWRLADPRLHAADVDAYRDYVHGSRGELSVAKHGYVVGRTGWFSDRTACYLAAGRPAVVQDTGLAAHLPLGEGLLVFDDLEQAASALHRVDGDWDMHARAARALAERYLDSDRVLNELLDLAGV